MSLEKVFSDLSFPCYTSLLSLSPYSPFHFSLLLSKLKITLQIIYRSLLAWAQLAAGFGHYFSHYHTPIISCKELTDSTNTAFLNNVSNYLFFLAQPVTVGWGKKATQFHGSLGKSAAQQQQQQVRERERVSVYLTSC